MGIGQLGQTGGSVVSVVVLVICIGLDGAPIQNQKEGEKIVKVLTQRANLAMTSHVQVRSEKQKMRMANIKIN